MATDLKGISTMAQDQFFAAVSTTQAAVLDGVRTMTGAMASAMPAMPALPAIPGMDKLPTPAMALGMGFDFAERLLAAQRDFTERLLAATTPAPAAPAEPAKATKTKA